MPGPAGQGRLRAGLPGLPGRAVPAVPRGAPGAWGARPRGPFCENSVRIHGCAAAGLVCAGAAFPEERGDRRSGSGTERSPGTAHSPEAARTPGAFGHRSQALGGSDGCLCRSCTGCPCGSLQLRTLCGLCLESPSAALSILSRVRQRYSSEVTFQGGCFCSVPLRGAALCARAGRRQRRSPWLGQAPELCAVWHGPACSACNCRTLARVAKSCHSLLFRGWYHFTRG